MAAGQGNHVRRNRGRGLVTVGVHEDNPIGVDAWHQRGTRQNRRHTVAAAGGDELLRTGEVLDVVALFLAGVVVGYMALERGLGFLLDFGGDALTPIIGADFYLKFAMRFILAFGLAFEFPVFLFGVAAVGGVASKTLRSNRRWALLVILIAAAIITPSGDPMTLMLLSVPLYVLYELTILAIRIILRR